MRHDLKLTPDEIPLADLRPVLMPSPILATGKWVGPYHYFPELPVSMTWAFLRPQQTMLYLSQDFAGRSTSKCRTGVEERGKPWRRDFNVKPWTHVFRGASAQPKRSP